MLAVGIDLGAFSYQDFYPNPKPYDLDQLHLSFCQSGHLDTRNQAPGSCPFGVPEYDFLVVILNSLSIA